MNNGPGVLVNSRYRCSSTKPAPSQAAHEYRPEPAWRCGVSTSEVIQETNDRIGQRSRYESCGRCGRRSMWMWMNTTYRQDALALDTIDRRGSYLQSAACGRDGMWRGASGNFTPVSPPAATVPHISRITELGRSRLVRLFQRGAGPRNCQPPRCLPMTHDPKPTIGKSKRCPLSRSASSPSSTLPANG